RLPALDRERATALLASAGFSGEIELAAAVSPKFGERFGGLIAAVFEAWAEIGVRVAVATPTVESYREAMHDPGDLDLMFTRWTTDYDDPDNFTYGVFHSRAGWLRRWWTSPELDDVAESARAETRAEVREALYRRFETSLVEM